MNKRLSKKQFSRFHYESLESRQVLTYIFSNFNPIHHLGQETQATVLTNLTEAPEISEQAEHGELRFNESEGTLTYHPESGFTGSDTFSLDNGTEFRMRVWETTYAVQDWAHVQGGQSETIDVLRNDYVFKNQNTNQAHYFIGGWSQNTNHWQQDSSQLTIVGFESESAGTLSIAQDGKSLEYTAADGFTGTDLVTYTIEDANGHRSEATLTIEVSNQTPDNRYLSSEAQWQQHQVEDWLARNAGSLTNEWRHDFFIGDGVNNRMVPFTALETNTFQLRQLTDVQEGDIVKTDGNFVYYVTHNTTKSSQFSSYLSIVDVSDPASPQIVSTTGFEQAIHDLYLDGDRAAVILNQGFNDTGAIIAHHSLTMKNDFDVLVLDVANKLTPTEVYRAQIDGSYTDARLVGSQLFVISAAPNSSPSTWAIESQNPSLVATSPGDYIDAILEMDQGFGLPSIVVSSQGSSQTITVDATQIVDRDDAYAYTLITTFDLQSQSGTPQDIDFVETSGVQEVYVSDASMYLFDGHDVIKFDLNQDTAGVTFAADGELNGNLISHSAANEKDGYLRVTVNDWDGTSDLRIFEQVDDNLVLTSQLDDIAPGERIYSTHYSGDQVLVVTFRQVDPLFVIDVSNPNAPTINGELKITGVSNYLQLIDDGLLLSVGYDADPANGRFESLQVSLFDVSNPNSPELLDRYTFEGGRSTKTPLIEWVGGPAEHHAVTYDFATGTLALPIFSQSWSNTGDELFAGNDSAISLFQIDRENGIQVAGQVEFDSKALRTLVVGDNLVYLSEDGLKTASRLTPTNILASIDLPTEEATRLSAKPINHSQPDNQKPERNRPKGERGPINKIASSTRASLVDPQLSGVRSFSKYSQVTEGIKVRQDLNSTSITALVGSENNDLDTEDLLEIEKAQSNLASETETDGNSNAFDIFFSDYEEDTDALENPFLSQRPIRATA